MNIPHSYQLFTTEGSRKLDERTITEFGIDGFTLMEIAGTRAADFILQQTDADSKGLIVCGKGNNAGDALVVARLLSEHAVDCTILFVSGIEQLSSECTRNLELLNKLENDISIILSFDGFDTNQRFDFLVDGMLGTGLHTEVNSDYSTVINWMNEQSGIIYSMDIPSGLSADSGNSLGVSVNADFTLAFGTLKQGFYLNDGTEQCGEIILCELPFPSKFKNSDRYLIHEDWVEQQRSSFQRNHKYDGGVLYIIAGSEGLTGAAVLAAKSAWATGLGGVVLITPKALLDIYEKSLVQIIKKAVGEQKDTFFKPNHLEAVQAILHEKPGVLLIGPGLGRHPNTIQFIQNLVSVYEGKVVLDADALYAISEHKFDLKPENTEWILTPHLGELKKLSGLTEIENEDRIQITSNLSNDLKSIVVSKGMPAMVVSLAKVLVTAYETRIFARAGFGDVLAGKIAGLWVNEKNSELACTLALLDGKHKAENQSFISQYPLEPMDLI